MAYKGLKYAPFPVVGAPAGRLAAQPFFFGPAKHRGADQAFVQLQRLQQANQAAQPDAAAARHDAIIRASWERCVREHRLDPTRMQEAVILPQARLREHQDQMDAFLSIARHGLESLYHQVAGQGYVVLLTDARGVTVDFLGDLQMEPHLRRAGLYLGADWSEHHAGTCGVGTAIATGQALTVHQDDHFDATHIPLSCTAAPLYDPLGRLNAILDISALTSPQAKSSQHLALQLVKVYANRELKELAEARRALRSRVAFGPGRGGGSRRSLFHGAQPGRPRRS